MTYYDYLINKFKTRGIECEKTFFTRLSGEKIESGVRGVTKSGKFFYIEANCNGDRFMVHIEGAKTFNKHHCATNCTFGTAIRKVLEN